MVCTLFQNMAILKGSFMQCIIYLCKKWWQMKLNNWPDLHIKHFPHLYFEFPRSLIMLMYININFTRIIPNFWTIILMQKNGSIQPLDHKRIQLLLKMWVYTFANMQFDSDILAKLTIIMCCVFSLQQYATTLVMKLQMFIQVINICFICIVITGFFQ